MHISFSIVVSEPSSGYKRNYRYSPLHLDTKVKIGVSSYTEISLILRSCFWIRPEMVSRERFDRKPGMRMRNYVPPIPRVSMRRFPFPLGLRIFSLCDISTEPSMGTMIKLHGLDSTTLELRMVYEEILLIFFILLPL